MALIDRKLEDWKRKLLDLTRRNPALFFKPQKPFNLRVQSPDPQRLLQRLLVDEKGRYIFIPPPLPDSDVSDEVEDIEDDASALFASPGPEDIVFVGKDGKALRRRIKTLHRAAHEDFEERALQTLHLAFGLLNWSEGGSEICTSNGKSAAHDVARPCQEIRDRMGHDFDFPLEEYGVWCNDCWGSDRSIGSRKINYRKLERRVMPEPDEIVQRAVTDIRSYLSGLSHPQLVARRNALEALAIKNSAQSQIEDLLFTNVLNRMRNGWRWRRQVVLCDAYIVDFIDDSRGAILEIDGVEHALDPKLYWDQVRDAHLRTEGYRIVRLWNGYVHDCIYWSNRLSEAGCDILARRIETYFFDIAEPVAS